MCGYTRICKCVCVCVFMSVHWRCLWVGTCAGLCLSTRVQTTLPDLSSQNVCS